METHTEGPWWIESETAKGPWEISDVYGLAAEVYGEDGEGLANARLIAAAPDLLEALKSLFADWVTLVGDDLKEQSDDVSLLWASCEKAIAKAEKGDPTDENART